MRAFGAVPLVCTWHVGASNSEQNLNMATQRNQQIVVFFSPRAPVYSPKPEPDGPGCNDADVSFTLQMQRQLYSEGEESAACVVQPQSES